jgi:hypothetical protein
MLFILGKDTGPQRPLAGVRVPSQVFAGAGGAMLLTMVFFVRGWVSEEWVDGWVSEEWVDGWADG